MDVAAIYIRLSKEDHDKGEAESESVQNQRMILDSYAHDHGWKIYDYYIDEDWSGSDRSRPEFNRMIEDSKHGKFNIVLVKTQSRFARDNKYIEDYIHEMFHDEGIRFVSVVDNIDTTQKGYKLNSRIHAIFDEEQLDLLSANIRRSFEEKSKQGQFFGSMPPYGYKKDPNNKNHLIIDDEAARVVQIIFEMTAAGSTYMEIAKYLNNCGYLIPSEYKKYKGYKVDGMYDRHMNLGKWTRDMVRTFLTNEVYIGTIVNHKSTVVNFRTKKKRNLPKSCHVKVENMHDAIIDIELWDKVQELRHSRHKASNGENDSKHPLSSKVFCGTCGSKMYKCKSGGIPYFRCYKASSTGECSNNKRIRIDVLESLIIDKINDTITQYINGEDLSRNIVIINRLDLQLKDCEKRKSEIQNELNEDLEHLEKMLEKFIDGAIERSVYEKLQNKYLENKELCEKRLKSVDKEIAKIQQSMIKQNDKEEILKKYSQIDKLTIPIVQEFIDSIIVGEVNENGERDITINMEV